MKWISTKSVACMIGIGMLAFTGLAMVGSPTLESPSSGPPGPADATMEVLNPVESMQAEAPFEMETQLGTDREARSYIKGQTVYVGAYTNAYRLDYTNNHPTRAITIELDLRRPGTIVPVPKRFRIFAGTTQSIRYQPFPNPLPFKAWFDSSCQGSASGTDADHQHCIGSVMVLGSRQYYAVCGDRNKSGHWGRDWFGPNRSTFREAAADARRHEQRYRGHNAFVLNN